MPGSTTQLRQYIRSVLAEKAISPAQATKQDLALCIEKEGSTRMYVLYDPDKLEALVRRRQKRYISSIVAVICVDSASKGHVWDAASIRFAAAEHGYGPLMYDIVMASEGGLMADRESVKPAAKKVWQYYKDSRPDVIAKPLDDKFAPKTEPKIDDAYVYPDGAENSLNYAYFATRKPNITGLRKNHTDAMKKLANNFNVVNLIDAASHYFGSRYQNG